MRKYSEKKKIFLNDVFIALPLFALFFSILANLLVLWSLYVLNREMKAFNNYSNYYAGFSSYMAYSNSIWDVWEQYYGNRMSSIDRDVVLREIYDISKRYNIDPILVLSIVFVESKGNPRAVSIAGARGLMQIMPSTFRYYSNGMNKMYDPVVNIRVGVSYLRDLIRQYRDLNRVLIHYNGGSKALKYLPKETKIYVQRVRLTYKVFSSGDFGLVRDFVEKTSRGVW